MNTYYKYGPTPDNTNAHWYEFPYDGDTGAQFNSNIITLHFIDGGRGDDDLSADGRIVDIGGPVLEEAESIPDSDSGGGGGCFIAAAWTIR